MMPRARHFMITGGMISALIAILHLILIIDPKLYRYIAPDQGSGLALVIGQGLSLILVATAVLALIFAIWAAYAFSAAGLIRPLPLLRPALIAIAVIYILRGLFLFTEIRMVLDQGYPFRFVLFSTLSLVTGLLYLLGVFKLAKK